MTPPLGVSTVVQSDTTLRITIPFPAAESEQWRNEGNFRGTFMARARAVLLAIEAAFIFCCLSLAAHLEPHSTPEGDSPDLLFLMVLAPVILAVLLSAAYVLLWVLVATGEEEILASPDSLATWPTVPVVPACRLMQDH